MSNDFGRKQTPTDVGIWPAQAGGLVLPFNDIFPTIADTAFIAPTATIIGDSEIGAETGIWYHCVIRGDDNSIRIGARSNIQDGTVVHVSYQTHATWIGDDVSIGHLAMIHGCTLQDGCFVGMRATVLDGAVVESGAMLAAGALLTPNKVVPTGQLWGGNPARFMRQLRDSDKAEFTRISSHYTQLARRHRSVIQAQSATATTITP